MIAADEADARDFLAQVRRCAERAEATCGAIVHHIAVAEVCIALSFSSRLLETALLPALAHLIVDEGPADAGVTLFDAAGTPQGMPPPPSDPHSFTYRGDLRGRSSDGVRAAFHWMECSLNLYDRDAKQGFYWVAEPEGLPYWSKASPLRTMLGWILGDHGAQLIHAACVGNEHVGLLIAGRGGVGKSTTSLAAVAAGMRYVGDDYVAVRRDPPRAFSLYNTAKLTPAQATCFPALAALANTDEAGQEKAVIALFPALEERIVRSLPLLAIATPCFANAEETMFAAADPVTIQRALAFTTIAQLPHAGGAAHAFLGDLAGDLPQLELRLGRDLDGVARAIAELIDHRESAALVKAPGATHAPLLSVIVPVYNGSGFLPRAIASILSQRYAPMEIIVVDDGSLEDLAPVIERLPVDVRFVRQNNAGPAAARNRGLEEASGELVAFLDVDDTWAAGTLERLAALLASDPDALVARGRVELVREGEGGALVALPRGPGEVFAHYIGAGIFRRAAFETVGAFDASLRFGEDTDWFVRAAQRDVCVLQDEATTLLVCRHGDNMTRGKTLVELNTLAVLKKALDRKRAGLASP